MGRVQPLLSQLLHVPVGKTKQPVSTMPTRLGRAEDWQVRTSSRFHCILHPLWPYQAQGHGPEPSAAQHSSSVHVCDCAMMGWDFTLRTACGPTVKCYPEAEAPNSLTAASERFYECVSSMLK